MSAIPLHIQRRFEQRSAARFVRPVALVYRRAAEARALVGNARLQPAPSPTLALPASQRKSPPHKTATSLGSLGHLGVIGLP
jgi:hypothetical protein